MHMLTLSKVRTVLIENVNHELMLRFLDGSNVPAHFHITEVGYVKKDFIDCGGTRRSTETCNLQTLVANDYDHRLLSDKLSKIIEMSLDLFPHEDLAVEVEHEESVISQYPVSGVEVAEGVITFILDVKHTACLAPDKCGLDDVPCCGPGEVCEPPSSFMDLPSIPKLR